MNTRKEGRELPAVTVNQFSEGKGCSFVEDLLWGSTDAGVRNDFCPVFTYKFILIPLQMDGITDCNILINNVK